MSWGRRHLSVAGQSLVNLVVSGRLKTWRTQSMKRAITKFRGRESEGFNDSVARLFESYDFVHVQKRLRKIKTIRIGGSTDLGDIDVLAADALTGSVLLLECKDLEIARTPKELAGELAKLFVGTERSDSVVKKHQRRADWIRRNLDLVIEFLLLDPNRTWTVQAAVVVDEELFSPHMYKSPLSVWSYHRLKTEFIEGWVRGKRADLSRRQRG